MSAYDDAALPKTDSMAADLSQLSALQRRIYQTIAAEAPECPEGVDLQVVKERCRHVDPAEIQYVSPTHAQGCRGRVGQRGLHLPGQR